MKLRLFDETAFTQVFVEFFHIVKPCGKFRHFKTFKAVVLVKGFVSFSDFCYASNPVPLVYKWAMSKTKVQMEHLKRPTNYTGKVSIFFFYLKRITETLFCTYFYTITLNIPQTENTGLRSKNKLLRNVTKQRSKKSAAIIMFSLRETCPRLRLMLGGYWIMPTLL